MKIICYLSLVYKYNYIHLNSVNQVSRHCNLIEFAVQAFKISYSDFFFLISQFGEKFPILCTGRGPILKQLESSLRGYDICEQNYVHRHRCNHSVSSCNFV